MKLTPGINVTNILQAALTHADPKNADTLINKFFALLGSENEKATRKHIDEIDPRSLSLSLSLSRDFGQIVPKQIRAFKSVPRLTWEIKRRKIFAEKTIQTKIFYKI